MGISIYTKEFVTSLAEEYLGNNLVAMLLNAPDLGIEEVPTSEQLQNTIDLTMAEAANLEVNNSNNYKRAIITLPTPEYKASNKTLTYSVTSEFIAIEGDIGPFTHIAYATQTNLTDATDENGNNAGDVQGVLVKVEALEFAPLSISPNIFYNHVTNFIISTRIFN
jgi:hypothetical protein